MPVFSQGRQVPGHSDGLSHLHVPGVQRQRVGKHGHGRAARRLPRAGPEVTDFRPDGDTSGYDDVTSDLGDSWRTEGGETAELEMSERTDTESVARGNVPGGASCQADGTYLQEQNHTNGLESRENVQGIT